MPQSPAPVPDPAIVARLRAAGCVFAEDEARLIQETARTQGEAEAMAARRADGLPLELVLGWAEFCGLRVAVRPGVFIPRRRTEFLACRAIELARDSGQARVVLVDLCCGSGAIGAAILAGLRGSIPEGPAAGGRAPAGTGAADPVCAGAELHAADLDPVAVACARANIGDGGRVYQGDLYDALPERLRRQVTILTANVPYVPTADIGMLPPEARLHEPPASLDGGADGLALLRRVAGEAPSWLAPGGTLLIETSERQLPLAVQAVAAAGLRAGSASDEELGATIVTGTRAASPASRA